MMWCQARANRDRWEEEVLLVQEEMRRTICYFVWEMDRWGRLAAEAVHQPASPHQAGKVAYASKQVQYRNQLITVCVTAWEPVFVHHRLDGHWMQRPLNRWDVGFHGRSK